MTKRYSNKKQNLRLLSITSVALLIVLAFYDSWLLFLSIKKEMPKEKAKQANYSILIDTEERTLYLLNNGYLLKSYPCAIGKTETPSPLGGFTICEKSHWGKGFGGYWMGLDCSWGKYGIHGTTKPDSVGFASSHGCFRMISSDAAELYGIVPCGTPVYVCGGCYGAFGNNFRTISPYMFGRDVQLVQKRLKEKGYYNGSCNGKYNSEEFKNAIHSYQKDNGLYITDYVTKKMLNSLGFILMD